MAPELLNTDARKIRYNSAVDVYSFAIILNALWRQRKPYNNDAFASVLHLLQSVQEGLRPDLPEDCPEWISELMKGCWDGDPSSRTSSHDVCLILAEHAPVDKPRSSSLLWDTAGSLGGGNSATAAPSSPRQIPSPWSGAR